MKSFFLLIALLLLASSCTVIKEYEKVYLNDPDMELSARSIERYETNFQVYRESASGAPGGQDGGGCGWN